MDDVEFKACIQEKKNCDEASSKFSINGDKCLVCYENKANIVLLPCRHGGICHFCG
jgi:metal-dependent hydrolase (beta-lactamase superfamily II)